MTKYRKSPDKDLVIIPGVGRVAPGQILEGPQYARFVGIGLLEEILEEKPTGPTAAQKAAAKVAKALQKKAAKEKAEAAAQAAADEEAAEAEAAAALEDAVVGDEATPTAPDADDTRQVAPVSEAAAEAAVEAATVDPDKTVASEGAKMEKRAAARRKKRSSKKS